MNEGLKAAVIEAIRIFASVLVFFLLGFFRFYHGFDNSIFFCHFLLRYGFVLRFCRFILVREGGGIC